jgi:hypothetical protein
MPKDENNGAGFWGAKEGYRVTKHPTSLTGSTNGNFIKPLRLSKLLAVSQKLYIAAMRALLDGAFTVCGEPRRLI